MSSNPLHARATPSSSSSSLSPKLNPSSFSEPPSDLSSSLPPSNSIHITSSSSSSISTSKHSRTASSASAKLNSDVNALPSDETVLSYKLIETLRSGDLFFLSKLVQHMKSVLPLNQGNTTKLHFDKTLHQKLGSPLHLAIGIAPSPCIDWLIKNQLVDINEPHPQSGETPLHLAAKHGRLDILELLLHLKNINDTIPDKSGKLPLEVAKTKQIADKLISQQNLFVATSTALMHDFSSKPDALKHLKHLFSNPRVASLVSVHHTDPTTGSTILHEAAKQNDIELLSWCLFEQKADPFVRDRKGKYFYELTKDEKVKALFKEGTKLQSWIVSNDPTFVFNPSSPSYTSSSPSSSTSSSFTTASATSSCPSLSSPDPPMLDTSHSKLISPSIRTWIHSASNHVHRKRGKRSAERVMSQNLRLSVAVPNVQPLTQSSSKELPRLSGILYKWTNYASGYKARWFVLEGALLSYYKNQDDVPDSCRGSISMKVATILTDSSDRHRFDVLGKGSIRYHLRAEHVAEAQRWIQVLNQSKKLLDETSMQNGTTTALPDLTSSSSSAQDIPSIPPSSPSLDPLSSNSPLSPGISEPSIDEELNSQLPHEVELPVLIESCRTQLELQKTLITTFHSQVQSISSSSTSIPSTEKLTHLSTTLQSSISSFQDLFQDLLKMYQEREDYWKKQCDFEKHHKMIYEENLRKLASDYDHIETEARHLVDTLHRRSESSTKSKSKSKKSITRTTPVPPLSPLKDGEQPSQASSNTQDLSSLESDDRSENIQAGGEDEGEFSYSDEDVEQEEEEFFDAMGADDEPSSSLLPLQGLTSSSGTLSPSALTAATTTTTTATTAIPHSSSKSTLLITPSLQGYESDTYSFSSQLRTALPVDHALLKNEVSLWSVLKNAIGKDLSKITLPVYFNEPISILQRLCEDIEYSQLLDLAWKQTQSDERMLFVAAFAMSNYASTVDRTGKPFNPLLGETFEYVRKDKGFRYISEQVSHHPPISACHCESNHYEYFGEVNMKNKFWGKSLEIHPLGVSHVRVKRGHINEPDEHYSWRKVTTCVHNLIVGTLWIDHYGDMEIINHQTKDKCILTFKPTGWRNKDRCAIEGKVYPKGASTPTWEISGTWDDKLVCRPFNVHTSKLILTDQDDTPKKNYILWKRSLGVPLSPSNFNLTSFALTLNQLPPMLSHYLCPTDCRLRPDQRAMENGEYELASQEKHRLEEKQRATRKKNEEKGIKHHTPRWFIKKVDPDTKEDFWEFTREYWKEREITKWTNVPDIY